MNTGVISIRRQDLHYVVKINGRFFCTADTYEEAIRELEEEGIL